MKRSTRRARSADLLQFLLLGDAARVELAVVRRHDARGGGVPRAELDVAPHGLVQGALPPDVATIPALFQILKSPRNPVNCTSRYLILVLALLGVDTGKLLLRLCPPLVLCTPS